MSKVLRIVKFQNYAIFQIYYFENDKWIEWNIEDHKDEIYRLYLKII